MFSALFGAGGVVLPIDINAILGDLYEVVQPHLLLLVSLACGMLGLQLLNDKADAVLRRDQQSRWRKEREEAILNRSGNWRERDGVWKLTARAEQRLEDLRRDADAGVLRAPRKRRD